MDNQPKKAYNGFSPYSLPVILNLHQVVINARKQFDKLVEFNRSFDDVVRDVIAHTSIDSHVKEDVKVLKESYRRTYLDEPEVYEIIVDVIDILSNGFIEELRVHRVYDDVGSLNYQFTRWLEDGTMILTPIKKIQTF